jgi:hypothetical protein
VEEDFWDMDGWREGLWVGVVEIPGVMDGGFVESYRANLVDVAEIALEFLTQLKFRRDYLLDITG